MMTPYFGEFLIIPMPLELSLERCSNACHYCFSNLNGYQIKGTIQSIFNQITGFHTRKDLASQLLRQGYPVCFSNRSDPFCKANARNAVKACEIMTELGIDIAFQTKGGPGIDDVLSFLPPSCWYVSITFDNDVLCKRIEPGAPVISERLELVAKLVEKGHSVTVGINPYVPEWVKDKRRLVEDIKAVGAYGVFCEGLHFSREQLRRLKPDIIAPAIIQRSSSKKIDQKCLVEYEDLRNIVMAAGLEFWSYWNYHPTKIWKPYQDRYKCFPIVTDFINYCMASKADGDIVTFVEFEACMHGLPENEFKIDSYILSINRSFKNMNIPVYGSAKSILQIFWTYPTLTPCPANHPYLSIVVEKSGDGSINYTDLPPEYLFSREKFDSVYVTKKGESIL